jgi:hypothetical protein
MATRLVCSSCGTEGAPRRQETGLLSVELALWILGVVGWETWHWVCLLIPVGYTIYRIARGTTLVCRACGATLVPTHSPVGPTPTRGPFTR